MECQLYKTHGFAGTKLNNPLFKNHERGLETLVFDISVSFVISLLSVLIG